MTDQKIWLPGPQKTPPPKLAWRFSCPMKWSDLKLTKDPNVRDCSQCKETVHYVTSFQNFLESVEKGRCVSVDTQDYGNLFADHRQNDNAPCVVAKEPPISIDPRARTEPAMPEMLGRVDMVPEKDFIQKPDARETRDDFGNRRLGRVVKRKRPEKEDEK